VFYANDEGPQVMMSELTSLFGIAAAVVDVNFFRRDAYMQELYFMYALGESQPERAAKL